MRQPDLQLNNIFVSDTMDVLEVIDRQHYSILPLFLQAGPPRYSQNYGDLDSKQVIEPRLPKDFSQLSTDEQDIARETYRRRQTHPLYIAYTAKLNEEHFDAYNDEPVVLKTVPGCGHTLGRAKRNFEVGFDLNN